MLQALFCCYFRAIFSQLCHEVAPYLLQKCNLLMYSVFPCKLFDALRGFFELVLLLFGIQVLRVDLQLAKVIIHVDILFLFILIILLVNSPELPSLPHQGYQLPLVNTLPFFEVIDDLMRSVLINKR